MQHNGNFSLSLTKLSLIRSYGTPFNFTVAIQGFPPCSYGRKSLNKVPNSCTLSQIAKLCKMHSHKDRHHACTIVASQKTALNT